MKPKCGIIIFLLCVFFSSFFNSNTIYAADSLKIRYFSKIPVIDGKPDEFTKSLPIYSFSLIEGTSENLPQPKADYKIAYNSEFLYLLVTVDSDSVTFRDRAYQNGDGFHMVIAMPKTGNEDTDEFYVLRFSPKSVKNNFAGLKGVWYYNIDLSGKRLSADTRFEVNSENGKTCYELLLPWSDVSPYHPFMKGGVGFNLCFVKAIGKSDKVYYFTLPDDRIQNELSKRKYVNLSFENPLPGSKVLSQYFPDKRSVFEGNKLEGTLVAYSPKDTAIDFSASIVTIDNYSIASFTKNITLSKGFSSHRISMSASEPVEGGYNLRWRFADDLFRNIPVTIIPFYDQAKFLKVLGGNSSNLSDGTKNTMIYRINEIKESLSKLKPYETAGNLRNRMVLLERDLKRISGGEDLYKTKTGIFRRAYLSKIDNTYEPYSVKIPENYNPAKKYPLLIMLHGSGQDDRGMLEGNDFGNGDFIEAAPNGRGTSNCFSADNSQDDIRECIADVAANYPVDETKIVLAGFSMGGYGVFRTFFETPNRFAGLAVFSGHPNLANKWLSGSHPDFTDSNTLKMFKNIPMFIYHDKLDLNCPFEIMEGVINKLKQQGNNIEPVISSGKGHNILNETNKKIYYKWLKTLLNN